MYNAFSTNNKSKRASRASAQIAQRANNAAQLRGTSSKLVKFRRCTATFVRIGKRREKKTERRNRSYNMHQTDPASAKPFIALRRERMAVEFGRFLSVSAGQIVVRRRFFLSHLSLQFSSLSRSESFKGDSRSASQSPINFRRPNSPINQSAEKSLSISMTSANYTRRLIVRKKS